MKVVLASDHAGFASKKLLKNYLENLGYIVEDVGTFSEESCDYPDYAFKAANSVASGLADRGILICGTGIGVSICANKVKGVRCALCSDKFSAEMTRLHNDANMLAMGARVIDIDTMKQLCDIFLTTPFSEEEKHIRRINKIAQCENK